MAQTMRRDVTDVLVQGKVITPEQQAQARELAGKTGKDIAACCREDLGVHPFHVLTARAVLGNMKPIDLAKNPPQPAAVNLLSARQARQFKVIPVSKMNQGGADTLFVAIGDVNDMMAIDDVRRAVGGVRVQPLLAEQDQFDAAMANHYPEEAAQAETAAPVPAEASQPAGAGLADIMSAVTEYGGPTDADDLAAAGDEDPLVQGPVIRIAHSIIQEAVKAGASDIHVEPGTRHVRVRYRIDGVLHEVMQLPKFIHPPLSSRYKIMAEMNIAERRVPQDGRIGISVAATGKDYDLRVSCLPTLMGEKIVMRILDKGNVMIGLNRLGFFPDTLSQLEKLFSQPNGMLLATGPTGAGKSTTLYSVLNQVNSVEKNIMTVEDPVEYQLGGISQVAVQRKAGLTFATALRSFMRQDPDIIMVGEIRDLETAEMGIQASLTGHLVLSSLHTNDAASTVTRMVDMGVEPFLVSATLIGALAQRLGRRICSECVEQYEEDAEVLRPLGYKPESPGEKVQLSRGRGCDRCRHTGYKGRIGIYELMTVSEEVADLVVRRAPVSEIRRSARLNGMKTLQEDGLRKVLSNITTVEEISRVVFTGGH